MREWVVVEKPLPFDLVRFRYGRYPSHVGMWAGYRNNFLHVEKNGGVARLAPITDALWGPRFFEFRRHRLLMGAQ